jgi:hypothetical protein
LSGAGPSRFLPDYAIPPSLKKFEASQASGIPTSHLKTFRSTPICRPSIGRRKIIPNRIRKPELSNCRTKHNTECEDDCCLKPRFVVADVLSMSYASRLAELAVKNKLPSFHQLRPEVEAGGLISYGPDLAEPSARAAAYVDRLLKGANPGDLPVEQPTKFELVVNLKTAKALGLTIPLALLARANEVIE